MQAACRVSTPMLIPHLHPLFLRRMKGSGSPGHVLAKKTTRWSFLTRFFYPAGSPYPTDRARALACRWDLAEER